MKINNINNLLKDLIKFQSKIFQKNMFLKSIAN